MWWCQLNYRRSVFNENMSLHYTGMFSTVKMKSFIRIILIFVVLLLKTLLVDT